MRRPTTLWAASLALLSAPLLMLGDAAPTPQRQYQQNRRYLIPVRRQVGNFDSFPNGSGDGGPAAMSSPSPSPSPSSFDAVPSTQPKGQPQDAGLDSGPVFVSTTATYATSNSQPDPSPSTYTPPSGADPSTSQPTASSAAAASADSPSPSAEASSSTIYLGLGEIISSSGAPAQTTSGSSVSSTQMADPPAQNAAATGSAPSVSSGTDGPAASQTESAQGSQPTSSQGAAAMPAVLPANAAEGSAATGSAATGSAATGSSGPSASASGPSGSAPAEAAATGSAPAGPDPSAPAASAPSAPATSAPSTPVDSTPAGSAPSGSAAAGVAPPSSGSGAAPTGGASVAPVVAASPDNAPNTQSAAAPPPSASNAAPAAPSGGATGGASGDAPPAPTGGATGANSGAAVVPVATPPASGGTGAASAGPATPPPASPPTPTSNPDPAVVAPQVSQSQGNAVASPSPAVSAPGGAPLITASLQTGSIVLPIPSGTASVPAISDAVPLVSAGKIPPTSSQPPTPTVDPAIVPVVNHNSVAVTGTNTETALSIATSLLIATTIPAAPPDASLASTAPKVIKPADGVPVQEPDEVLCQVAFFKQLNYMFMVENYQAVNQMFAYLPEGLENGINATIRMQSLQPLNTLKTDGFVTCMAYFLCPRSKVDTLALQLHTPNSPVYNNSNEQVATMMKLINPQYPLVVDPSAMGSYPSSAATNPAIAAGQPAGGSPFGSETFTHQDVKPSSSYVTVPVVAGAFVYASAMMIVARRYRQKRRQSHMLENSPIHEPAWMTGRASMSPVAPNNSRDSQGSGNVSGRSIRSQPISAPVMAQNSLGWN